MGDEGCVEDALQDLRCVEEALQQAERAVRRHKRRNGQLLAQLVHILGPRNSAHTTTLMQEVKLAQTACARHVAHYQRRASIAQATLQIAELWDRLVVPWFTQSVMCDFYNGVVRRRLRELDTRLQSATRRLSGRYRWKALQETKQEKSSICDDTQQSAAVDWVLVHYMPFMCHALLAQEGNTTVEGETNDSDTALTQRRRSLAEILYLLLHVVPDAMSTYYPRSLTGVTDTSSATSILASDDITLPRDTAKLLHLLAPPTEGPLHKMSRSHTRLVMLLRYVQGLQTLQHQLECITGNTSQCEEETSHALPLWPRACATLQRLPLSEDSTECKEEQIAWGHTMRCTRTVADEEFVALSALSAACCEALCGRMWFTPTVHHHHKCFTLQPYEACSLSSWGMQYRRIVQTFDLHWEQVTSAAAATQLAHLPCRTSIAFVYALLKDSTSITPRKDVYLEVCSDEGNNNAEDKDSVAEHEWCAWWRHVLHTLRCACGKGSHNNGEGEGEENDEFVRLVGCPAWCCTPCIESTQQGSTSPSQAQPLMECGASALGPALPLYRHCPLLYCIEHAMASAETQKSDN